MIDPPSPVLARLDHRARDFLLARCGYKRLARDQVLFLAGEVSNSVYVVTHGALKLVARDVNGRETILGLATSGELVGEQALIECGPHALDAIAVTASRVLALDGEVFLSAVLDTPAAAHALMLHLVTRTRWVCDTSLERASGSVKSRLAGRLLVLADSMGQHDGNAVEVELPFGQRDLAGLAGMCRESVCKTMRDLKAKGVVEYRGRRLRILRRDALERLRCGERVAGPYRSTDAESRRRSRSTRGT